MTIEEAIKMALEYENNIRDIYYKGADQIKDQTINRFFRVLGDDEQSHVDYLEVKLIQWQEQGRIDSEVLKSSIPLKDDIAEGLDRVRSIVSEDLRGLVKRALVSALEAEIETSDFYKKMVEELPEEGKNMFKPFITIEEKHISTVQYELDSVNNSGYWFDFMEFDMEAISS